MQICRVDKSAESAVVHFVRWPQRTDWTGH